MGMVFLLLLCISTYSYAHAYGCSSNPFITDAGPLVRTFSGSLIGKHVQVFQSEVAAFLGIPYALPPVGERRFLKPCPLTQWENILNATTKPRPCMQYSSRTFSWIPTTESSEDCLYLNVWTPAKCCCSSTERLPVVVWIYGGGFYSGSSDIDDYDGSTMASSQKVIVASVNYRVGIFGFLNSGSDKAPGNVGLFDQNLALQWIRKNIEHFGGDPNRITIMGQSAGAWSVSLHMISPMSRNLFSAAILQSGAAYHPQIVDSPEVAYQKANVFAKTIGCLFGNTSIESDPVVFECINKKSSQELAKFENEFTSKLPQYFLPTYGDEFLPVLPIKAANEGQIAPVPLLIGNVQNEGTIFLNYIVPTVFKLVSEPSLTLDAAKVILASLFSIVLRPSSSEIYDYYFQNVSSEIRPGEIAEIIAGTLGDYIFNCPTQFFAEKSNNALMYWMTHRSHADSTAEWVGVQHCSEIPFVFGVPMHDIFTYTPEDARFSADLMNKWIKFAETGHPLGNSNAAYWPQFTTENQSSYELNPKSEGILTHPRAQACEFWRPYIDAVPVSSEDS